MKKTELENLIRTDVLAAITEALKVKYDTDVLPVSAGELALPVLDAEGNESFALIKVSVPRGTRNGQGGYTPYDGYKAAELYQEELAKDAANKAAAEKEKARKEEERARKRAEKAALKAAKEAKKEGE